MDEVPDEGSSDSTLKPYLTSIVEAHRQWKNRMPEGFHYLCMEDFILEHGRSFIISKESRKTGRIKLCYMNATNLMNADPDMVYVEGYAMPSDVRFPVMHAWCVHRRTCEVHDPTWEAGSAYFGIPFKERFVLDTILRRKLYGVIDDWESGFPLLRLERTDTSFKEQLGCSSSR